MLTTKVETNLRSSISNVENLARSMSREARSVAASRDADISAESACPAESVCRANLELMAIREAGAPTDQHHPIDECHPAEPCKCRRARHSSAGVNTTKHCRSRSLKWGRRSTTAHAEPAGTQWFPGITGKPPRFTGSSSGTTKSRLRFARNYDIHFRAFSKRYRSTSGANETWAARFWAARFLQRLETAKTLAAGRLDDNSRWDGGRPRRPH